MGHSPILQQYGTWAVTEYGVECLVTTYFFDRGRVHEPDWIAHMSSTKTWCCMPDFMDALNDARLRWPREVKNSRSKQPPKKSSRSSLSSRIRFSILRRDDFRCSLCGRSAVSDGVTLHVDHQQPISRGGTDDEENLWTLCSDCNLGKSNSL
jgi:5-methylcytosine-specific restriction endonuclease McrA